MSGGVGLTFQKRSRGGTAQTATQATGLGGVGHKEPWRFLKREVSLCDRDTVSEGEKA